MNDAQFRIVAIELKNVAAGQVIMDILTSGAALAF